MKLASLFNHLHRRAIATGQWQSAPLAGGAALHVGKSGTTVHVLFSRDGKRLSTTEIVTFRTHCQIPDSAQRIPADAALQATKQHDGVTTWYVGYSWEEPEAPCRAPESQNTAQSVG